MQEHAAQPNMWVITAVVVGVVLFLRIRRMSRERPLRVAQLWIVPALYGVFAAVLFWSHPPTLITWSVCLVALVAGAALGWQRGRMMRITVDPETHAINQKASPAAMLFLVALIVVRTAARALAEQSGVSWHIDALAVTDVLIAFALGVFAIQRLEMYLRATRLLEEARAARAG